MVTTPTYDCMFTNNTNLLLHCLSTHRVSNILTCVPHTTSLFLIYIHLISFFLVYPSISLSLSSPINLIMCLTSKITTRGNSITISKFDPCIDLKPVNLPLDDPDFVDNCSYISYDDLCSMDCTNDSLSILQLNMQGLINKQSDLNKLLHAGSTNKVDVALLCETWLRAETVKFIDIPHYTLLSKEKKGKKGGGVCILTRDEMKIR